ncbi:MAG: hypothetical protein CFE23_09755 [Flavobacterium sp. BFFFF1]|uniref:DUF2007 domain-containing protein n=1 Tax=unclassified Flavobacterium TaxID=196869 RepID=UPI000BDC371F|nr:MULTISPECIES: DUF2007 domain-containing protein [unclassified Flavobacterium]OYU80340.1 MAG: hypothetical protein CFE23_09755 [Flavobacterium sp. BFFFF1]
MGLINIFSGSEIMALRLRSEVENEGVSVLVRDHIQSATLGGFGSAGLTVDLYIEETDYELVEETIDEFRHRFQDDL